MYSEPKTPKRRTVDPSNAEGQGAQRKKWQELLQSANRSHEGAKHMAKLAHDALGAFQAEAERFEKLRDEVKELLDK